jgi:hypothetical protein
MDVEHVRSGAALEGRPARTHLARRQPRAVHQVAQDQSVSPADDEAGAEQERPILDRGERHRDAGGSRGREGA